MKKTVALLLSAVMLAGMFAGCGVPSGSAPAADETAAVEPAAEGGTQEAPAEEASGDQVVLNLIHRFPDEPYKSFFESVIANYEAEHPNVKVNLTFTATDPYAEKLQVLMASDEKPDIFFSFGGEFLNRFIREGLVMDLKPHYDSSEWTDEFNYALVKPFEYEGGLYGLDYDLTVKLFFYNLEIFEEYNLSPPETWDELIEVCETLQANDVLPISEGDLDQWPATHLLSILFHVMVPEDVRVKDYNAETGEFTDPSYVAALDKYTELIKYMNTDMTAIRHSEARMAFATGGSAMAWLESIEMTDVDNDSGGELNYGMFKFPEIPGAPGNQNMLLGSPEGFSVCSETQYPEEALDLLGYICGTETGKRMPTELQWFNAAKDIVDESTAPEKVVDVYGLLMETEGLVNWIDNECHTLLRDVFYSRSQEFLNGTMSAEDYMGLIQEAAAEAKAEMEAQSS